VSLHAEQELLLKARASLAAAAYATAGKPLPQDIERCAHWLLNSPLRQAYQQLLDLQLQKGVALVDILQQLHP
jgi:replication factor C subunit 3/5